MIEGGCTIVLSDDVCWWMMMIVSEGNDEMRVVVGAREMIGDARNMVGDAREIETHVRD